MSAPRRTVVLEGPLAHAMARLEAARVNGVGLQLLSLPSLAARLAGGFIRLAEATDLDAAIRAALDEGNYLDFESIRLLPGMTRAAARTLHKVWHGDFDLDSVADESRRLSDLKSLEQRVRARLPAGALTPRDLRDAATSRIGHAPAVLGNVTLDRLGMIEPVWRPLVTALCDVVHVEWRNPGSEDNAWFPGTIERDPAEPGAAPDLVSCANPKAEVVEALRWARELIATGRAQPQEIAICATTVAEWDDHFMALSGDESVPVHFSHGHPAVASWDGQYCAALADVLVNGLSQDRVRRLLAYAGGRCLALKDLPRDWALGLRASASLMELEQWRRVLDRSSMLRSDGGRLKELLLPVLEKLAMGPSAAEEVGESLLSTATRRLWAEALRRAPASALNLTLMDLRVPDNLDPGVCVVWGPAAHVASAPRRWLRLLGMTARSWPRTSPDDPLLPDHILPRSMLDCETLTDQDRRVFGLVSGGATRGRVLSRSRRNAQGGLLAASPLLDHGAPAKTFRATRVPPHAFSEPDRLLARLTEAHAGPRVACAVSCWVDWHRRDITPHDGNARADHPVVIRALEEVQSATSLRRMLRDPLAFVWRYGLGWRTFVDDDQPLSLDARAYGELVHALLKLTVDTLEISPGFTKAQRHQVDAALSAAKDVVSMEWPLDRSVPPPLLWRHTIDLAGQLALQALTKDAVLQETRSWTEVPFGRAESTPAAVPMPWDGSARVLIPSTQVSIKGTIDRLDLKESRDAVRVTDYKTGAPPKRAAEIVLGGGAELQRVIYAIAARQLLQAPSVVVARLLYLGGDKPVEVKLPKGTDPVAATAAFVTDAMALLRQGVFIAAGPDVTEDWNEYRLLLPASKGAYLARKRWAFDKAYDTVKRRWRQL